ncbi:hypothetical protein [Deinococcus sp. Arct2-2]|nr:hypothetical protein [Deinococcus sp. Arct2-2]
MLDMMDAKTGRVGTELALEGLPLPPVGEDRVWDCTEVPLLR